MKLKGVLGSILWFVLLAPIVCAQSTGSVTGVVLDEATQRPLPGASVKLQRSSLTTDTDRAGVFQLLRVPTGPQTIIISYIGYEIGSFETEVKVSQSIELKVSLKPLPQITEYVEIRDSQLDGQARALNQQKTSPNIVNIVSADQIGRFPDPNAAEATQRIPGIVIQRDQGEGRFVSVRGTEPRLNSVMINGERIPAPEGDIRYVALDVVPADLLEAIEVSKALTPDMDSDAIGGAVNLVTKNAPPRTIFSATAGLGYNSIVHNGLQNFNATIGSRFFDNKLGALVSTSFLNTNRGSQNFEVEYDDGELDSLETRDYSLTRRRFGINPVFDWKASNNSEFFIRGIYNRFSDNEFRRFFVNAVGDEALERNLRDRYEVQEIISGAAGGRFLINNILHTDFRITYSYAEEAEPKNITSTFVQGDVRVRAKRHAHADRSKKHSGEPSERRYQPICARRTDA